MSGDTPIPWFTGRTGEDHLRTLNCFPHSGSSAGEVRGGRAGGLPHLKETARHLPDREPAALLGRQHSPLPAEILGDPEVLHLSLRAFRADLTVLEPRAPSPVPGTPWPVPVTALRGRNDYVPEEHARQWSAHTARFTHRQVGSHFPFRDDVAAYCAAVDVLMTEAVHAYQEERNR